MNISLGPRSNQTKTAGLRRDGALPMFARDQRTGSMKQFTPGEPKDIALATGGAGRPHSRVLVADDGETDRFLTVWQLGKLWPVEADILLECAADGEEALDKIRIAIAASGCRKGEIRTNWWGFTSKSIWQPGAGRVPPRRPRVHSRPHSVTRAFDCQSGPATLNSPGSQGNNHSTAFATCRFLLPFAH